MIQHVKKIAYEIVSGLCKNNKFDKRFKLNGLKEGGHFFILSEMQYFVTQNATKHFN